MTLPEPQSPVCRLCETPLPDPAARCPACGMSQDRDVTTATKWRIAAGLLALYVFIAVVLVVTR